MLADQISELDHHAFTRRRCHTCPASVFKSSTGCSYRYINVRSVTTRSLRDDLSVDRGNAVENYAAASFNACTIDKGAAIKLDMSANGLPV